METKVCAKCGRELPVGMFNKSSKSTDGLQSYCRPCQSEANKKLYQKKEEESKTEAVPAPKPLMATTLPTPAPPVKGQDIKAFSTDELVAEMKRRNVSLSVYSASELAEALRSYGKRVMINPTPRDAMAFLKSQGYKGTLTYTRTETIDLSRI